MMMRLVVSSYEEIDSELAKRSEDERDNDRVS